MSVYSSERWTDVKCGSSLIHTLVKRSPTGTWWARYHLVLGWTRSILIWEMYTREQKSCKNLCVCVCSMCGQVSLWSPCREWTVRWRTCRFGTTRFHTMPSSITWPHTTTGKTCVMADMDFLGRLLMLFLIFGRIEFPMKSSQNFLLANSPEFHKCIDTFLTNFLEEVEE